MPLDLGMAASAQQEGFGDAFLLAVAGVAGCAASPRSPDDDSIDWTLSCRLSRRPKLDIQMKTWIGDDGKGEVIRYPLRRKNYDDLILTEVLAPRLLVLVALPREMHDWLSISPDRLVLRRCGFWLSLVGLPPTDNETTVTVEIPRTNLLSVEALQAIMKRIDDGGAP
jgi:hypothetical protein